MQTLELRGGARMPALGLGTWKSAAGEVGAAVHEAIRIGYRHIDCAAVYGNEAEVGAAIAAAIAAGEVRRDELWLTSKLWCNAHARQDVVPALKKTLADLRLERLDLYLVHWPIAVRREVVVAQVVSDFVPESEVSLLDTWRGMEDAHAAGLTRAIGVSNYGVPRLTALARDARVQPEVVQIELHPYLQQRALVAYCQAQRIAVTGYSPLGSGDRPASMKATGEPSLLEDPIVSEVSAHHGASAAQVLIAWQLHLGLAVIPKSVNPARLAENFEAKDLVLDPDDLEQLAGLDLGRRYVDGKFWLLPGGPHTATSLWT
jgi:alcohol dehydrogenase (NADP+)